MSRDNYDDDWAGPRTRRHSGGHARDDHGRGDDSWPGEQDPYGQARSQYGQDPYGEAEADQQEEIYPGYGRSGPYAQIDPYAERNPYGQADPDGGADPYAYGQTGSGSGGYDNGYAGQGYGGGDNYAEDPYQSGYDAPAGYDQYGDRNGYAQDGDYYGSRARYDSGAGRYQDGYGGQNGYADSGGYDYTGQQAYRQPDSGGWQQDDGRGRASRRGRAQEAVPPRDRQRGRSARRSDPDDDRHNEFFSGFSREEEPRRRRAPVGLIALLIILLLIGGIAGVGYHYYSLYKTRHQSFSGPGTGKVDFTVPDGASGDSIGPKLVSLGIVGSMDSWASYVADKKGLQPGKFKLRYHMSNSAAWKALTDGKNGVNSKVTVVDGLRTTQVLKDLAKDSSIPLSQFKSAIKETSKLDLPSYANGNPQGYLFPATYDIVPGTTTALKILQEAVQQFTIEAKAVNLPSVSHHDGFTEAQVITEASLLEAEVPAKYYGKVATVIDNRLNGLNGITHDLQLDSTVAYANNTYTFNLTQTQMDNPSPYNTFKHPGLPPGPIDSPGDAAIRAALHPTPGPWTYFVTVNKKGLTLFTNSLSQFTAWSNEAKSNGLG